MVDYSLIQYTKMIDSGYTASGREENRGMRGEFRGGELGLPNKEEKEIGRVPARFVSAGGGALRDGSN